MRDTKRDLKELTQTDIICFSTAKNSPKSGRHNKHGFRLLVAGVCQYILSLRERYPNVFRARSPDAESAEH
jgi:hypothetical protein